MNSKYEKNDVPSVHPRITCGYVYDIVVTEQCLKAIAHRISHHPQYAGVFASVTDSRNTDTETCLIQQMYNLQPNLREVLKTVDLLGESQCSGRYALLTAHNNETHYRVILAHMQLGVNCTIALCRNYATGTIERITRHGNIIQQTPSVT